MGVSTNGQICFGIAFEEGFEFPWGEDGDEENWWREQQGYKPSMKLYDERGNHLPSVTQGDSDRVYAEQRAFNTEHPLPVAIVNYCSGDCPMYILAVPSSVLTNLRGYAERFDPADLSVTDEEKAALLRFCADHGIEVPAEPAWLLTSYWG